MGKPFPRTMSFHWGKDRLCFVGFCGAAAPLPHPRGRCKPEGADGGGYVGWRHSFPVTPSVKNQRFLPAPPAGEPRSSAINDPFPMGPISGRLVGKGGSFFQTNRGAGTDCCRFRRTGRRRRGSGLPRTGGRCPRRSPCGSWQCPFCVLLWSEW